MEYGVQYSPDHPSTLAGNAKLAEDVGFDFIGIPDSQSIMREMYASLAHVANATSSIKFGASVTNPVTRHPVVTTSAMCTVDEIAGGRTWFGLATGDSALHTIGEEPARLSEVKEVLELFGELSRGNDAEYGGNEVKLKWVQNDGKSFDIPRFLAAEGPKTLKLAGSVADGVIIGTGLTPDLIRDSIETVEEGAREAGRDPNGITKWLFAKSNIGETREAAIDEIKMALAGSANHAFRFTLEGKNIPEEYKEPIQTLTSEYNAHEHEQLGRTRNRELVEELGLTEFLANRFSVAGTPEDCREKLREIGSVERVDGVLLTAFTEDERGLVSTMGERVLPEL